MHIISRAGSYNFTYMFILALFYFFRTFKPHVEYGRTIRQRTEVPKSTLGREALKIRRKTSIAFICSSSRHYLIKYTFLHSVTL